MGICFKHIVYIGQIRMVLITRFHKKCKVAYLRVGFIAIALSALFMPTLKPVKSVGDNLFTVMVNDKPMGKVADRETAERLLSTARRNVVGRYTDIVLIEAETDILGEEVYVGKTDDEEHIIKNIEYEFKNSIKETMQHSYTVKIDNYMVNVSTSEEASELLEASIAKFAGEGAFEVSFTSDSTRELPVFVPVISKVDAKENEKTGTGTTASEYLSSDGFYQAFDKIFEEVEPAKDPSFEDYEYGIVNVSFADEVEVVESYLPSNQIMSLPDAIDDVTKDKEEKTIYEVVPGDTLSGIANKTGVSLEDIIALNENITSANSVIRVGDEITVTVPQPELSVNREELVYYEGTYEAPIIYQYNDDWYTTTEVTLQDPSSGYHKAVEKIIYNNNNVVSKEVVMEEVVMEAIPKIVEKGTKIPPTYIKPLSGGHITSGFGYRTATIAGMTSRHQAIDYGTPTGTSVMASCGGKVTQAGWLGTYGYVIFINHPDGKQTRYAHLSKILVSVGDYVSQGQKIALSGSTGVSTGPHLHFEMRINGVAVNPLNYISY